MNNFSILFKNNFTIFTLKKVLKKQIKYKLKTIKFLTITNSISNRQILPNIFNLMKIEIIFYLINLHKIKIFSSKKKN